MRYETAPGRQAQVDRGTFPPCHTLPAPLAPKLSFQPRANVQVT